MLIYVIIDLTYVSFAKEKSLIVENNIIEENVKVKETNELCTGIEVEETVIVQTIWEIEIPKINLKAPIEEGTTEEVMNEFVGHFQNTSKWTGNIGLAAHNRGYPVNYFGRIKELQKGDEIIYRTNYGEKRYTVSLITIIEDTDWTYLQESKQNKITLITCVENQEKYRRCIQAIERNDYK